ncbi:hypothetical protein [Histidinibacterium lentulum]|uniref:Sel1 repeat family protein n=1 Tax=Histidinibacterium lentulum TaxID=2480588 RepID=A0A3N2R878_9RHOB|nr:hypothetical protein [Histidinibacterium lentulum]ROU03623.1 hypothetical protein EAT49_04825 [Histidinibacterium lentulum]
MDDRMMRAGLCLVLLVSGAPAVAAVERPESGPAPALVPVQDNRVTETLDLPTWRLQQARRRMLAGETISFDDMRELADLGDGLASWRYANRLMALDDPGLVSAAALYYATAAYTGRDYAVRPLVRILEDRETEISEARLGHLENALRSWALRGNRVAQTALIDFYATGHPFGFHPEKARQLRLDLAEAGETGAALDFAVRAMSGRGEAEAETVVSMLEAVAASDDLGNRTTAENLLRMIESNPKVLASGGAGPGLAEETGEDRP